MRRTGKAAALCAVLLGFVLSASAQEKPKTIEQRLEALERANAALRQDNADLRRELESIKKGAAEHAPPIPPGETPGASKRPANETTPEQRIPASNDAKDHEYEAAQQKAMRDGRWNFGVKPNGGGFFAEAPDTNFELNIMSYLQFTGELTDVRGNSFDGGDFRIQRARTDFVATFYKKYTVLIEPDFAAKGGTSLIEGWLAVKLADDAFQLKVGKYTGPFSTEDLRSSRSLDTINRYIALVSMFTLPGLGQSLGAMGWGQLPVGATERDGDGRQFTPKLTYYVGVFNGNSSLGNENAAGLGGNARDTNGDKELQLKLIYQPVEELSLGLGFDHNIAEHNEMLTMSSLSGMPFISVPGGGERNGVSADFFWQPDRFSLRGEGLYFDFKEEKLRFFGGFLQAAYFLDGNLTGGLQPLVRIEFARAEGAAMNAIEGNTIVAGTLGLNWYLSGNVRVQINYILEHFNGRGNVGHIESNSMRSTLLTQLQIKL